MSGSLLVIAGMPKCGTTALSSYLIQHGHARLLVPGLKEPYLFAEHDYVAPEAVRRLTVYQGPRNWLLDASAGYSCNVVALDRMRVFAPTVIACFRNPFERSYSAFRNYKLAVGGESARGEMGHRYHFEGTDRVDPGKMIDDIILAHHAPSARPVIAGYAKLEAERLLQSTFLERVTYELQFFTAHRVWPFRSCLAESFYTYPAKQLIARFAGALSLVSLPKLSADAELRANFLATAIGVTAEAPPLPSVFSLAGIDLGENAPDFTSPAFDTLRGAFRYDLTTFEGLLAKHGVDRSFLDFDELGRFVHASR